MLESMVHLRRMEAFWALKLQVSPEQFTAPGTHVIPIERLTDCIVEYRLPQTSLLCVPPSLASLASSKLTSAIAPLEPESLIALLSATLFPATLELRWHDFVWYATELPAPADPHIRALTPADAQRLESLRDACTQIERDTGDVEITQQSVIGWLEGEDLIAAASLIVDGQIADVGVLTHPDHRGRGLGKSVVAALIRTTLDAGLTVQYMTQQKNTASRRIAAGLGLQPFLEIRCFSLKN